MNLIPSKSVAALCLGMVGVIVGCSSSATQVAPSPPATAVVTSSAPTVSSPATTTTEAAPAVFRPDAVGHATATPPPNPGNGAIVLGPGGGDLTSVGYMQEEFFISGTASAYQSATALSADGRWTASPIYPQAYTTRIVVRRPIDPKAFTGNVAVEWLNVTAGFDTAPDPMPSRIARPGKGTSE